MSARAVRVEFFHALGRLWRSRSAAVATAAFLSVVSLSFVHFLLRGDGASTPLAALWAVSAVPALPVLAALLTMRMVAGERENGGLDAILSAPVLERDVVLGRCAAAWAACVFALLLHLAVPLAVLPWCAPALREQLSFFGFLPALAGLSLQCVLWCACGICASACFRQPAMAALASVGVTLLIPNVVSRAAFAWMPALRAKMQAMPFAHHAVDVATGVVPVSTTVFYLSLAFFFLFAATKAVACARFRGRAGRGRRASAAFAVALALVFSTLLAVVSLRYVRDIPAPARGIASADVSVRTKQVLAETHGEVRATLFLAAKSPEFMAASRILRGLSAAAHMVAGTRLVVESVDPRWDLGRANALVRAGTPEGTVVFSRGRRRVEIPVAALVPPATNGTLVVSSDALAAGEAVCASALQRLAHDSKRETVYWAAGHGEAAHDSYDSIAGFSDVARDLLMEGYDVRAIDLPTAQSIPDDCSVLVVAGAREPFSKSENARLDGWLKAGGRMLVLAGSSPNAGAGALLADWGVRILPFSVVSDRTQSGADVVAAELPDHRITAPLAGCTLVFESPVPLKSARSPAQGAASQAETSADDPSAAARDRVDRVDVSPLAMTDSSAWGESDIAVRPWTFDPSQEPKGPLCIAAAVERGGGASEDLALRPTRIVVVGDASFVSNGALARRGNANRDFFLNSVAWLAGLDAITAARTARGAVQTGLDRTGWLLFAAWSAGAFPCAFFLVSLVLGARRRRGL